MKTTLGKRLQIARKRAKLTQRQVAIKLNICSTTVSTWERDERMPSLGTLAALAKMYGTTSSELLEGL